MNSDVLAKTPLPDGAAGTVIVIGVMLLWMIVMTVALLQLTGSMPHVRDLLRRITRR